MKIRKSSQRGSMVVGVALAVLVVATIGAAGYYATQLKQPAAVTSTSNLTQVPPTAPKAAPRVSQPASIDESAAVALVSDFYNQYVKGSAYVPPGQETSQQKLIKAYGTPRLINAYASWTQESDPVVCGQNTAPVSIKSHAASGSTETIVVQEAFTTPLDITVKVVNDGGLKIDQITCPVQ